MTGSGGSTVVREDPETTKKRNQLRKEMLADGKTYEQITTAMIEEFQDRRRVAWRHAHGWAQGHVADRFNRFVGDPNGSMTAQRISDFERWPLARGSKPTPETLAILAEIYATHLLNLVDDDDRQNMTLREQAALAALEKQLSASVSDNTRRSTLSLTYAASMGPQQLPNTTPYFVGRTEELEKLTTQLDDAATGTSPVVITAIGGTAGIGKTALALYWAHIHRNRFLDGQLYVNLRGFHPTGTPMTPQEAIRGFLDAFGTPVEKIPTSLDAQAALYRDLVKDKKLVIVLDNARDTDQVRPLLPDGPTCMVLITSRQQLTSLADGDATYITLGFLSAEEARQLLTEILGLERIEAEPNAVDELINRCVHLPIALRIAAWRIKAEPRTSLMTLVGQLRQERQRLAALSTGDSIYFDIRAVFSWSYTALTPGAARLFRLLGLHPGPDINLHAAASLAGLPEHEINQLLTELLRASLLEESTPGRYSFHDLLSTYAVEQARIEESESQQHEARHRVLDHYLHTGFSAERCLAPHRNSITVQAPQPGVIHHRITDYEQAMNWFTAERAVLLLTINYTAAHGCDIHAWQLPWTLATFLSWRGHWHDLVATQHAALAAAERLDDRTAQAFTHKALGHANIRLGHHISDGLANLHQALALFEELGDRDVQAETYCILAWAYERQRQYDKALAHAQHALTLSRSTGNRFWQARALSGIGWYYALLSQYQQALIHCQDALSIFRKLGDRHGEAAALDSLGYAYHHLGQHDQAITYYQQSVALCRELGDHYGEADTLIHLGENCHATGNNQAARQVWQQALTIFDQLDHPDADTVRDKLASLDTDPDQSITGD